MTIKDLAMAQSAGIDIKVVETDESGATTEKASFNSNYYGIITENFLAQEIASMTVRKTNGQNVYIEVVAAASGNTPTDTSGDSASGGDTTGD